jgi:hypothetical protein
VVDVWEGQINIGYGGDGASMRERAAAALARDIQSQR